jgi:hypothetical protein
MTAIETFVYDIPGEPRRPTLDDTDPTFENRMPLPLAGQPYAEQANLVARLVAAYGRMLPVASIEVHFLAGVPFVDSLVCCSEVLTASDLTVTDNGTGDVTVTWPANSFPAQSQSPEVVMVEDGEWLQPTATAVTNGVNVFTRDLGGILTDGRFKVRIY